MLPSGMLRVRQAATCRRAKGRKERRCVDVDVDVGAGVLTHLAWPRRRGSGDGDGDWDGDWDGDSNGSRWPRREKSGSGQAFAREGAAYRKSKLAVVGSGRAGGTRLSLGRLVGPEDKGQDKVQDRTGQDGPGRGQRRRRRALGQRRTCRRGADVVGGPLYDVFWRVEYWMWVTERAWRWGIRSRSCALYQPAGQCGPGQRGAGVCR
ncbi:hypothetical protein PMIN04_008131 [Paraphaeosphaeria minitans]